MVHVSPNHMGLDSIVIKHIPKKMCLMGSRGMIDLNQFIAVHRLSPEKTG